MLDVRAREDRKLDRLVDDVGDPPCRTLAKGALHQGRHGLPHVLGALEQEIALGALAADHVLVVHDDQGLDLSVEQRAEGGVEADDAEALGALAGANLLEQLALLGLLDRGLDGQDPLQRGAP